MTNITVTSATATMLGTQPAVSSGTLIDPERFKEIMSSAPGPATVVTALDAEGLPHGLTMSAVCSVSLDPPLVLACLDRASNTLAALRSTGSFTVNYLSDGREMVALEFASKSTAKFDGHAWARPTAGVGGPILHEHIAAYAACRLRDLIEAGDHMIAVGEVLEGEHRAGYQALAYARRTFFSAAGISA